MIALLPFSLCLLAFNCFALAKFNHFKDVFNKCPTQQQRLVLLSVAWISILLSSGVFLAILASLKDWV